MDNERQLEEHSVTAVAGAHDLAGLRLVRPTTGNQEAVDRGTGGQQDGQVDVMVLTGDPAAPQVDGPTAEEPMVEACPLEVRPTSAIAWSWARADSLGDPVGGTSSARSAPSSMPQGRAAPTAWHERR
jgi:hypothetical protein